MVSNITKALVVLIVTGLFSGLSPIAPGTAGTIAALVVLYTFCAFFNISPSQFGLLQLAITIFAVGMITVSTYLRTPRFQRSHKASETITQANNQNFHLDPKEVVIDEWAGMFTALTFANQPSLVSILVLFGLFRFFDASKIGPVGWFEALPGALGVMADDLVAGVLAGTTFLLISAVFSVS